MKKVFITTITAVAFFFFLHPTGTDLTAMEIKSVAVDSRHLDLILQNAEQTIPSPAIYINTCLTSNMVIITAFKESFTLHMNINYGLNLL